MKIPSGISQLSTSTEFNFQIRALICIYFKENDQDFTNNLFYKVKFVTIWLLIEFFQRFYDFWITTGTIKKIQANQNINLLSETIKPLVELILDTTLDDSNLNQAEFELGCNFFLFERQLYHKYHKFKILQRMINNCFNYIFIEQE